MAKTERFEPRQPQRPAPQAFAVAFALRASLGDMAERVRALVAVSRRILRPAAADRIEDDEDRPRVKDAPYWLTTLASVASLAKAAANSARV